MTARVTIVHERFTEFAGSEQVVAQLGLLWPDAPIVAPIAQPANMPPELGTRITSTALSKLIRSGGGYAHLLPALPLAMRRLPVGEPDLVVASHHAFANQVVHATSAPVVSYVHSPARWVWDPATRAGEAGGVLGSAALKAFAASYRQMDRNAAARVQTIVANSTAVAARIADWWDQPSQVIHPPVDTLYYTPDDEVPREDFLLLAGRLVPYKRSIVAIEAARRAGRRLIVAGDGRMRAECERLAGPHTDFVGRVSDAELRGLFRRCQALLMPGIEDFGIVPVEAQACGAPVVATGAGGAIDTVRPGLTGVLVETDNNGFDEGALIDSWTSVLSNFDGQSFDGRAIRDHAERFSAQLFRDRMQAVVERIVN